MMMMMLISLERLCSKEIWKQLRVVTLENLVLSIIIVCMKKLRFSSPLTAKVGDRGHWAQLKHSRVSGQNVIRHPLTCVFFVINISFLLWAVSLSCVAEVSIFTIVMASNGFFIKSLFILIEPHWSSLGLMNEWWKFWWVNKNLCQVIQFVSPWRNCVYDLQASNTLKTTKERHFISTWNVIVQVSVLPKRIVVDSDRHFDNLWGSHLQNQSELYHIDQ